MNVIHRRGWEMPESRATPEHLFFNRRAFLCGGGRGRRWADARHRGGAARHRSARSVDGSLSGQAQRHVSRSTARSRDEKINGNYNNFYEFSSSEGVARQAQALKIRPWTVKIDGMVEKPFEIGIDDLVRKVGIEERLYRHRCVEAWSMAIPWSGFPLAKLVEMAKPLSSAKYLRMETFLDKSIAPGQRQSWYPWPYVEGLTMAEASNELAFLATGAYGKPIAKQHGAPIRLAVPWKYGFKSIKSIVRFNFTDKRPKTYWEDAAVVGVRLLGQRQSGGAASALEPGERGSDRHRRAAADAAVQRLRRICRRSLQGYEKERLWT